MRQRVCQQTVYECRKDWPADLSSGTENREERKFFGREQEAFFICLAIPQATIKDGVGL